MSLLRQRSRTRPHGGSLMIGLKQFRHRIRHLVTQPVFVVITIFGNLLILFGSLSIYLLEHDTNSSVATLLDAVWWAVATVTTVGYGDVSPQTPAGKVV